MFKCDGCGVISKPREKLTKFVTATRQKQYPFRAKANRQSGKCTEAPETDDVEASVKKKKCRDDHGGTGYETITEINFCQACAR